MKLLDTKILSIVSHHISLDTWSKYSADERIQIILSLLSDLKKSYQLSTEISFDMPSGYETACGLYDHTISCLFLNKSSRKNLLPQKLCITFFMNFVMYFNMSEVICFHLNSSKVSLILFNTMGTALSWWITTGIM